MIDVNYNFTGDEPMPILESIKKRRNACGLEAWESVKSIRRLIDACRAKGLPVQVPQCGSMFSIFFTDTPVRDYATALRGDAKLFGRFFHACLARGVYLAPSAYEAGFLSTAHDGVIIDRACEVLTTAIGEL